MGDQFAFMCFYALPRCFGVGLYSTTTWQLGEQCFHSSAKCVATRRHYQGYTADDYQRRAAGMQERLPEAPDLRQLVFGRSTVIILGARCLADEIHSLGAKFCPVWTDPRVPSGLQHMVGLLHSGGPGFSGGYVNPFSRASPESSPQPWSGHAAGDRELFPPKSLLVALIGAVSLAGWNGFNGGILISPNPRIARFAAVLNTTGHGGGPFVWTAMRQEAYGKASIICADQRHESRALVASLPAAGFRHGWGASPRYRSGISGLSMNKLPRTRLLMKVGR